MIGRYILVYIYLIACFLICDHWFVAVFIQQSSGRKRKISFSEWWLLYKDSKKPVVADKEACY